MTDTILEVKASTNCKTRTMQDDEDVPISALFKPWKSSKSGNNPSPTESLSLKRHQPIEEIVNDPEDLYDQKLDDSDNLEPASDCVESETNSKDNDLSKPLGKYQCYVCPYNTHDKRLLVKHLTKHSGHRPHKCPVCFKSFRYKQYLNVHINTTADIKPYKCTECAEFFKSPTALCKHKKLHHSGINLLKCSKCDYATVDRTNMKQHMFCHAEERSFKCSLCNYCGTSKKYLMAHSKIHTRGKPYECEICHKRFREPNLLNNHRMNHFHNENVFQCDLCPAKLSSPDILRSHKRNMHNVVITKKSHKCPHCERTFALKGYLLHHIETHKSDSQGKESEDNVPDEM